MTYHKIRKNTHWLLIACLALLIIVAYLSPSSDTLTVHVRCGGEVTGKLSVSTITENGEFEDERSFLLNTLCQHPSQFNITHYQRGQSLKLILERSNHLKSEITAKYGENIHSDQNGFYLIIKVIDIPPYLKNDTI